MKVGNEKNGLGASIDCSFGSIRKNNKKHDACPAFAGGKSW